MRDSRIEWTDHTFNPWWGCTKVSSACDNCYAEVWAKRTGHSVWGRDAPRRPLSESYWKQPIKWDAEAYKEGRKRVFCASMADVFEWRGDVKVYRSRLWEIIEATPNLDWLLLTKRPHLVNRLVPWVENWPDNVWLGTTVESQKLAKKRIPKLLETGARIKFLSCEPLLEQVDLRQWIGGLDWVIAGGESGGGARPSISEWFRKIRDLCVGAQVPFLFKQWGDWYPLQQSSTPPHSRSVRQWQGELFVRLGKKRAGRLLDLKEWNQLPTVEFRS